MEERLKDQGLRTKLDKYGDMLYKIAYMRLQNVEDAEDVVQEAFFQYLKRKDGFESEEHERAWLIHVTLNACRKVWRSAWKRHQSGEEVSSEVPGGRVPEAEALSLEQGKEILKAVQSLPAKYRDVIHLFYYEELSIREISRATGRRESTVTSQLSRGRELLRKKLGEEYDYA